MPYYNLTQYIWYIVQTQHNTTYIVYIYIAHTKRGIQICDRNCNRIDNKSIAFTHRNICTTTCHTKQYKLWSHKNTPLNWNGQQSLAVVRDKEWTLTKTGGNTHYKTISTQKYAIMHYVTKTCRHTNGGKIALQTISTKKYATIEAALRDKDLSLHNL